MTKPADNTIAKKREVVMPAAAAATMETKAKGSATLANSDNHGRGLFVFLDLALKAKRCQTQSVYGDTSAFGPKTDERPKLAGLVDTGVALGVAARSR